ncbi:hypothetical protein CANCADRAFT_148169 [Tortispora caseinolytica NRRL Y-17796]|uniref:2-dehydropantoate 2-reductase n=1 Tax=Tortispora caseinolytica NRRL Y-17796 TaxID=767744 RepID=A0A1E4TH77_9ASCO|nr:hypothetical protein CANCADRAFT_148169 [Tortispora caseinolytica NRRL Y-17796]
MSKQSIAILGVGNIGSLIATGLKALHKPPHVTLLFSSNSRRASFVQHGSTITVIRSGTKYVYDGFNAAAADNCVTHIDNLIITTKSHQTVQAIKPLLPFLSSSTDIVLIQNGAGTYQKLKKEYWHNKPSPRFIQGVTDHGANSSVPFEVNHASIGSIRLAVVPESERHAPSSEPPYMLQLLAACPDLNATLVSYEEITEIMYRKLVSNCCINPLTALYRVPNGFLAENQHARDSVYQITSECCHILNAYNTLHGISLGFVPAKMFDSVLQVIKLTAQNWSSMFQDIHAGKQSEIDFINGFILDAYAEISKHGGDPVAKPKINKFLVSMIKSLEAAAAGPAATTDSTATTDSLKDSTDPAPRVSPHDP